MQYIRFPWLWIIESVVLFLVVGLLVKILVTNTKKIDAYAQKMWDSTKKSQAFLQQVDQEFDLLNKCAKSIKNVFLNFSRVYKEISRGTKTVEEAIRDAKLNLPEELRQKFSRAFLQSEEADVADDQFNANFSSADFCLSKSRNVLSDDEHYKTCQCLEKESELRSHEFC